MPNEEGMDEADDRLIDAFAVACLSVARAVDAGMKYEDYRYLVEHRSAAKDALRARLSETRAALSEEERETVEWLRIHRDECRHSADLFRYDDAPAAANSLWHYEHEAEKFNAALRLLDRLSGRSAGEETNG